jgi:DNA-binding NtrC family response regulator
MITFLPRLLVIDDLFGRNVGGRANSDRENLCAHFLWRDVTGDEAAISSRLSIAEPTADVVFVRGQKPLIAQVGDVVENDLQATMSIVRSGWPARELVEGPEHGLWSLVLLDLCFYTGRVTEASNRRSLGMPVGRPHDDDWHRYFGLKLLDAVHEEFPEIPVMILSGKPRDEVSLEFSRRGAVGFIPRDDLRGPELLRDALQLHGLLTDPRGEIVGRSLPLLLALRDARRAAMHRENILIRGERGSGKELVARYLHQNSASDVGADNSSFGPFIVVNSAIFTRDLFASEFFGIEQGTATGVHGKTGLIEAAQGGDLFLDEVADMPNEVQAAILRVLQERQFSRVGGRVPKQADVRFIAATNAAIEDAGAGFRADVFDRLRLGGTIVVPPLRDRIEDLGLLTESFIREAERLNRRARPRQVTSEALDQLRLYDWPGNIRELRSVLFDAVNRFPDVEYLVRRHIRLQTWTSEPGPYREQHPTAKRIRLEGVGARKASELDSIEVLLSAVEQFDFRPDAVREWAGRLAEVQNTTARLLSRYLQACIVATKHHTPKVPTGQIQVHPAVKLLTGNSAITASQSADMIKRLLAPLRGDLDGELREAYEIALRLRPRSVRAAKPKGSGNS